MYRTLVYEAAQSSQRGLGAWIFSRKAPTDYHDGFPGNEVMERNNSGNGEA